MEKTNDYFPDTKTGFNDGLYGGTDNMTFGGLAANESILGEGLYGSTPAASGEAGFGMTDLGSALGEGWDFLKGGLDTVSGLAGLYMDWDKLQSTKASARDAHNASRTQYNNYLTRANNASRSMGLTPPSGASARQNVKKSTV